MDYNYGWTNSAGNSSSKMFENNFSYAPSFYPESSYISRNGPNSYANTPCYTSHDYSGFSNFPPQSYSVGGVNQNARYQPYPPFVATFAGYNKYQSCHFHASGRPCDSGIETKCLYSQINCHQSVNENKKLWNGSCDEKINHLKSKVKKKRQTLSKGKDVVLEGNSSDQNIHPQINYDTFNILNYVLDKEVLLNNKDENECNKLEVTNEQNYADGKTYSCGKITDATTINEKTSISSETATGMNFMACESRSVALNTGFQNGPAVNYYTNVRGDMSTDLIFADATTNADKNSDSHPINNLDLSECQVTRITVPENSNSLAQNACQEKLENTEVESCFFKPIFEGKDENGEDVVILLVDSGMPPMANCEFNIETAIDNENLEAQNNETVINNLPDDNSESNKTSEFHFDEQPIKQANNEQNESVIFSHIDDYAAEEIVTTSKNKCPKTKKTKKKNDKTTDEEHSATISEAVKVECPMTNFVSEPSTSGENGNSPIVQKLSQSRKKFNHLQFKRQWKKHFSWKSNEPLNNIQRAYFRKFMKSVKQGNKNLMTNKDFWNMYKIIVNQIGGNVFQTICNMLPALIRNSSVPMKKSNVAAPKLNRGLKVKLPAIKKKHCNSKD